MTLMTEQSNRVTQGIISVIGCGRWGSMIAYYLHSIGENVVLYEPADSPAMRAWQVSRRGELLDLPDEIVLETNIAAALQNDVIIVSIGSQYFRGLMEQVSTFSPQGKTFVLCMKGIETDTGKRLSEIAAEYLVDSNKIAVWVGPGHVQDLVRGIPTCMVIDSNDEVAKKALAERFSSNLIKIYYGSDVIGTEIGAAAKNVIGIGAGLLDGADMPSLKGALISRGAREVALLIKALGGDERSAYGLAHLGDYEATVFSEHSHNRAYGEAHARGQKFDKLAEGYYTAQALLDLAQKQNLHLPIIEAITNVIYHDHDVKEELKRLFAAEPTSEF